jgi:hypothetical protein
MFRPWLTKPSDLGDRAQASACRSSASRRVPWSAGFPTAGLVGEVDDADVMASNIFAVLDGNIAAMSEHARGHALQFSWDQSMALLFGRVYRGALARAAARAGRLPIVRKGALVEA